MNEHSSLHGSRVLVDVTDYDRDQNLRLRENFVGIFLGVGELRGKPMLRFRRLPSNDLIQIPGVPADLWPAARELKYSLRQTGELVEQLDFIVQWVASDEVQGSSSIGRVSAEPE